jgi:hypothetical protein
MVGLCNSLVMELFRRFLGIIAIWHLVLILEIIIIIKAVVES